MSICFTVCLLIVGSANAIISIQVPNTVIELGSTDININCLVNDSSLNNIIGIQLTRSTGKIVSVLKTDKVFWQNKELQKRGFANASLANVLSSYLNLTIPASMVIKEDKGEYYCSLSANKKDRSLDVSNSSKIFLNVTDIHVNRSALHALSVLMLLVCLLEHFLIS